jgi:hypothetical protein
MQADYKSKIENANRSAMKVSSEKKQKIVQKFTDQYNQTEKEVGR